MQQKWAGSTPAYQRERRERLKEMGLCVECGANPTENSTLCGECKAYRKQKRDANKTRLSSLTRRRYRIENGLCMHCNHPAVDGVKYCEKHRAQKAEWNRKYNQRRTEKAVVQVAVVEPIVVDNTKPPWWVSFNCENAVTVWDLSEVRQ